MPKKWVLGFVAVITDSLFSNDQHPDKLARTILLISHLY